MSFLHSPTLWCKVFFDIFWISQGMLHESRWLKSDIFWWLVFVGIKADWWALVEICALPSAFLVLVLGVDGLLLWTSGLIWPNIFALFKYCYFDIFMSVCVYKFHLVWKFICTWSRIILNIHSLWWCFASCLMTAVVFSVSFLRKHSNTAVIFVMTHYRVKKKNIL